MPVSDLHFKKKEAEALLKKLDVPLTMSMFLSKEALLEEALKQRTEAAEMIRRLVS